MSPSTAVTTWAHGWAISRGTPPPTAVPGGWHLTVGLPGHRSRYVLHTADRDTLGRVAAEPGTWIKVAAEPARLRAALPPAWTMRDVGYLMAAPFPLHDEDLTPPQPYAVRVDRTGEISTVSIVDGDGHTVASGRLAAAGAHGIIDQVETSPAHRRRGLGAAVMRALSRDATGRGLHTGVLVATDEGRHLYRSLGWTVRSVIAAAAIPEN